MSHLFTSSGSGSVAGIGEGKAGCPEEGEPLRTPSPMAAIDPIFVLEPWETAMDFFFREVVVQRGEKMRRGLPSCLYLSPGSLGRKVESLSV